MLWYIFVVLPPNSNYVLKYEMIINSDRELVEDTEEIEEIEDIEDIEDIYNSYGDYSVDYQEEAEKLGVSNPELVEYMYYINDNIVLVSYLDKSIDVYDIINECVIKSIENINCSLVKALGYDFEGNLYVVGDGYGYCIDNEYNVLAEIEDLVYVDFEKGSVIVGDIDGELWKYSIYSFESLVDMALKHD